MTYQLHNDTNPWIKSKTLCNIKDLPRKKYCNFKILFDSRHQSERSTGFCSECQRLDSFYLVWSLSHSANQWWFSFGESEKQNSKLTLCPTELSYQKSNKPRKEIQPNPHIPSFEVTKHSRQYSIPVTVCLLNYEYRWNSQVNPDRSCHQSNTHWKGSINNVEQCLM